jgi:N-acetylneuraminic acid mutarotase
MTISLISSIDSFGQTGNFWTKKNDFGGGKRERAVAFSIGNFGYIGTGVDTAEVVLNDFWQYDPILDLWTQKADVPGSPRRDAVGFEAGGKGYVGTGIDNDESFSGSKLKDFWEYDPLTNVWVQKADFPGSGGNGVYFATGFSIDAKGYICCGKIGPNSYTNQLWEYKPSINQWTQRANFPGGVRYQLSSFIVGYDAFVGLGANQDIFKKDFWKYNAGTNQWSQISDLPASERGAACTFTIGSRGYLCIGTDGGLLDDLWEYNPISDQWIVRANYGGSERKNAVSFAINGKGYVGTGKGFSGKKASLEEYTPLDMTGTSDIEFLSIEVFPNPVIDEISVKNENFSIHDYSIFNSTGNIILTDNIQFESQAKISLRELDQGIYFISFYDHQQQLIDSKKIILN